MAAFSPISDVVHAPNRRGIKRYTIRVPDGVTKENIETVGYFGKYDFSGWQPNDVIEVLADFGILGYVITGANAEGQLLITILYYYQNSASLIDAAEIPMSPILEDGPANSSETVQVAIEALNDAVKELITGSSAGGIVAQIAASAPLTAQLWAAIVARHFSWDGTTLKIDIDADGNVNA